MQDEKSFIFNDAPEKIPFAMRFLEEAITSGVPGCSDQTYMGQTPTNNGADHQGDYALDE